MAITIHILVMNIIAVTQARSGSTRLPNKVLKTIQNRTLLEIHVQRILSSRHINQLIVATTEAPKDEIIQVLSKKMGVFCFAGSENNVLDRFYQAVKNKRADYIVRLTSDCPLIDSHLIDSVIQHTVTNDLDYCSNTLIANYPDGQDVEVFKFSALQKAWTEATLLSEKEHVTPYIWKNSSFKGGNLFQSDNFMQDQGYGDLRMTVDEPRDFELIQKLIQKLGTERTWKQYAHHMRSNPQLTNINSNITRNEGLLKSLQND